MSVEIAAVNDVNAAAVSVLVELVSMSAASAAVGPASGCETMGTGLCSGHMRRYSCPFPGGTFVACHSTLNVSR